MQLLQHFFCSEAVGSIDQQEREKRQEKLETLLHIFLLHFISELPYIFDLSRFISWLHTVRCFDLTLSATNSMEFRFFGPRKNGYIVYV
jgi:hypothetical protein